MKLELCDEALEYGRQAQRALDAAGGDALAQAAEQQPGRRAALVEPVLDELGAWQLDVRGSSEELEAAAALCRSFGYRAVPYPVAERLCRPVDVEGDGLVVVSGSAPAAAVGALGLRWVTTTLDGRRGTAVSGDGGESPRKSAFVVPLDLRPLDDRGGPDVALALTLPCWVLLGMLDRALELTRHYIREREQFGQPLASFQGVQFQLTDAEVERLGTEELAKYALWSLGGRRAEAVEDALALRLAAVEAADCVFRVAHQLHGAIGFCDETTLSWISRYSAPLRRLPFGLSATRSALTGLLGRKGLVGLFDADPPG